jgi:hypothetical protein
MRDSSAWGLEKARPVVEHRVPLAAWKVVRISSVQANIVLGPELPLSASVSGLWKRAALGTNLR